MTTKVHKFQSGLMPTSENTVFDLPVGVYSVRVDQFGNFFLEPSSVPEDPVKVYGEDTNLRADRYLETFKASPNKSMGALLIGEPGSGKTMLMRKIINKAVLDGISVILVEHNFHGANFNKFIHESLKGTSAIVAMDEFEKMYNMDDDEVLAPLLTLFDGPSDSHKLFLCSANNRNQIADPFFNRPSRFYFIAEFGSLGDDVIRDYIADHLFDKSLAAELTTKLIGMDKVNFDCLATAVREVNRCRHVEKAFKDLNVKEKYSSDAIYALCRVVNAETGEDFMFHQDSHFRPVYDSLSFYVPKNTSGYTHASGVSIDRNSLNDDEEHKLDKNFTLMRAIVDRSVPPVREDGCYVFAASSNPSGNTPKIKIKVYIKNTSRMFAF